MGRKLKLLLFLIVLIFVFPQKAYAGRQERVARYMTEDGVSVLTYDVLQFEGAFNDRERAWVVFYNLLCMEESEFVPRGVRLLSVMTADGGELIVNVSPHIKNLGGIYNEKHLRAEIVLTGLHLQEVEYVTLLIDGEPGVLPEGSSIERVGEWDELMD